jgi:hypothetical protein
MMHLNKLFFSSPQRKTDGDQKKIFYRHNDSSESLNTFYDSADHSSPSALAVSFNGFTAKSLRSAASNTTSSNKLFKSFSISGLNGATSVTGLSLGASSFIVNNQDIPGSSAEGLHELTPLKRMGNSVYGEVGKDTKMSGMNIKAIGKIKNVYVWGGFQDGENQWVIDADMPLEGLQFQTISAKILDDDGFEVAPGNISSFYSDNAVTYAHLYAFEIEHFMSANPIPSAQSETLGDGAKFFYLSQSGPLPYIPATLDYSATPDVSFPGDILPAEDFSAGRQFSSYLSYGDPYQGEQGNSTNMFKKGNFIFIRTVFEDGSPHVPFANLPDRTVVANPNFDTYLYAMTPGNINGSDAHGSFADAFVVLGNSQFEVSSLQVEFEFTEYDHGGITGTASKAKTK